VDRTAKASGADPVVEDLVEQPGDGVAEGASKLANKRQLAQQQVHPKALFPWRHETKDHPLPRLSPGTPESRYNTSAAVPRGTQSFIANAFLNLPTWQLVLVDWRAQLAESASYAFTRGVAGIISNVYQVPYRGLLRDDPSQETTTMSFDSDHGAGASELMPDGSPTDDAASSTATTEHKNVYNDSPKDDAEDEGGPDVEYMLDQPLRRLFQSAHEHGRDQLLVRLETTPVRAVFYSLFCLPFVSRRMVARDPSILERMRKIVYQLNNSLRNPPEREARSSDGETASSPSSPSSSFTSMYEYVQSQVERNDRLETTVELQVLVECEEVFHVVDRATGALVQGGCGGAVCGGGGEREDGTVAGDSSGKRRVWHLVSLEATSTTTFADSFPYLPNTTAGNWIITDIDDLLGPKKWYHPK
jgi:hypothetical protein